MPTTTLVVLADPAGGDDALGRLFNALAVAYDLKQRGAAVEVLFQGAGTRWPAVVSRPEHPVNGLWRAVEDVVGGVSSGCADVFAAREGAATCGLALVSENAVPGTSGLPSLGRRLAEGGSILTF